MTCRELIEFLDRYDSGDLGDEARGVFDKHLDDCPPCRDYLDSYRESVRLGQDACAAEDATVPEGMPEDLVTAIMTAVRDGTGES